MKSCLIAFTFFSTACVAEVIQTDICIFGGTSGGVSAAVQAARMGKKVILADPGRHLGGMTSGGLSAVDIEAEHWSASLNQHIVGPSSSSSSDKDV